MKVRELIKKLQDLDQDRDIRIAQDFGDGPYNITFVAKEESCMWGTDSSIITDDDGDYVMEDIYVIRFD